MKKTKASQLRPNRPFFTRDASFYKKFFGMLFFIAMQNIIVFSVNLADNVMLGNYNEKALAGASLVNQIHFLLQMVVSGCGEGLVVLSSQYWGKKETDPIKRILSITMRIALLFAILLTIVCGFFPEGCLSLLTNDAEAIAQGVEYLRVLKWSFLLFCISNLFLSCLRSVENVHIGTLVSFSTLLINVFLNYCLIFGHLGFPVMGSAGAALATVISRFVELVIIVSYVLFKEKVLQVKLRDLLSFDKILFKDFIRVATPAVVTSGIWGLAMIIQSAILGHVGSSATAASSVASTIFSILTVIIYGSNSSSSVLIGKAVSSAPPEVIREYSRTLQVIFLLFGLITGLLLFLSRDFVLMLYSNLSEETKDLSKQFMTVLSVTVIGTGYQSSVLGGIVKAGGSPKVQMINDMIFMWGLVLPFSMLAAFVWHLSPVVIFIFLKSDQILKCGTAFVVCNRYRWIKNLTRNQDIKTEPIET